MHKIDIMSENIYIIYRLKIAKVPYFSLIYKMNAYSKSDG
jgi:hypothetical protein